METGVAFQVWSPEKDRPDGKITGGQRLWYVEWQIALTDCEARLATKTDGLESPSYGTLNPRIVPFFSATECRSERRALDKCGQAFVR
jgi:hypothetical protein